ncbi:hemin uptake protein HemP [Jannaschia rubra]|uniref:hemin uptake protein HemP n=1 Tax=Jannaschia rubra TaxID=282197 RepID=UPI00248F49D7|nr:hemin uptake protein HemP [Jannaschia rubra]
MTRDPNDARLTPDIPVHAAEDILGDLGTARIMLDDQVYTLRLTRARKLILTK